MTSWADIINGSFEMLGGLFILLSIIKLHRDKRIMGVSWLTVAFFAGWGWWNLYYYPSLDQWWSFSGGVFIVFMNTIWLSMMLRIQIWGKPFLYQTVGAPLTNDASAEMIGTLLNLCPHGEIKRNCQDCEPRRNWREPWKAIK